jgi:N-acetyltransferase
MSAGDRTFVAHSERLRLRPLDDGDVEQVGAWLDDPLLRRSYLITEDRLDGRAVVQGVVEWARGTDGVAAWAIEHHDGRLMGMGNWKPDVPFLWVYEIEVTLGPAVATGRGCGTEAHRLVIDHLFETIRPAKVFGRIALFNDAMRAIVPKLGATEEGLLRAHARLGDRPVDLVVAGILLEEWEASRRAGRAVPVPAH